MLAVNGNRQFTVYMMSLLYMACCCDVSVGGLVVMLPSYSTVVVVTTKLSSSQLFTCTSYILVRACSCLSVCASEQKRGAIKFWGIISMPR